MKIVLAGNFQQYERWRKDNDVKVGESLYVLDGMALRGRFITQEDEVIEVGTFYQRPDAQDIHDEIRRLQSYGKR